MDRTRQVLSLVAFLAMVGLNFLANSLPLNGVTTAEISDRYPTLFTPAGYVFAIWGVIYLLLAGFVGYQLVRGQDPALDRVGYLFVVSSVLNMAWLVSWHWELITLSTAIMVALLLCLMLLYVRINRVEIPVTSAARWAVKLPFSIYLAWISVATVANVAVNLYAAGWQAMGLVPELWTLLVSLVAAVLGAAALSARGDYAFALVICWALAGVGVANSENTLLMASCWSLVLALGALMGIRATARRGPAAR